MIRKNRLSGNPVSFPPITHHLWWIHFLGRNYFHILLIYHLQVINLGGEKNSLINKKKKTGRKQIKCIKSSEQLWPPLPILCSGNNAQSPSRRSEHRSHESKSRWKLRPCLPHQWQGYKLSSDPRGTLFPVTENNVQTSAKTKCTILPLKTFVYLLWHLMHWQCIWHLTNYGPNNYLIFLFVFFCAATHGRIKLNNFSKSKARYFIGEILSF